ncbi:hypothetical protein MASR2M48_00460 [Spirochaetota bacterium]|jgi:hypothetical protein
MKEYYEDHGPVFLGLMKCDNCGQPVDWSKVVLSQYFIQEQNLCISCHNKIDLYSIVKNIIKDNFMYYNSYLCLGAHNHTFNFEMKRDEIFVLNFNEYGIPMSAKILHVNYTPQGGTIFPIEMHGNTPAIKHQYFENKVPLTPALFNLPGVEDTGNTKIACSVTWISKEQENISFSNILDSFEYYSFNEFNKAIIPLNVAVEEPLSKLMTIIINRKLPNRLSKVKNFLQDYATYGWQMTILLPLLMGYEKEQQLDEKIVGNLNRLKNLRNELAHDGILTKTLTKGEQADILTSVLFTHYYLEYLINKYSPVQI